MKPAARIIVRFQTSSMKCEILFQIYVPRELKFDPKVLEHGLCSYDRIT